MLWSAAHAHAWSGCSCACRQCALQEEAVLHPLGLRQHMPAMALRRGGVDGCCVCCMLTHCSMLLLLLLLLSSRHIIPQTGRQFVAPKDIMLGVAIGSGSFGRVYSGGCYTRRLAGSSACCTLPETSTLRGLQAVSMRLVACGRLLMSSLDVPLSCPHCDLLRCRLLAGPPCCCQGDQPLIG